jgi:thiamine biosynthesis lipoprotein
MTVGAQPTFDVHEFRAMGCGIALMAVGASPRAFAAGVADAVAHVEAWEQRFSRFRADSELERLNAAAGAPIAVSPEMLALVAQAIDGWRFTGGRFDPLLRQAVVAAGYDRDFAAVVARETWDAAPGAPVASPADIALDHAAGTITLPAGAALDLGGIAKGAWVDAIVPHLATMWPGGCVDAGGDLRVWGLAPEGSAWMVAVEHPLQPELDIAVLGLPDLARAAAVATSGRNHRRWATATGDAHHLIDPRTGRPADAAPLTVTVVAPTTAIAEVAAKALFVSVARGDDPALPGAALGIVIGEDGRGVIVPGEAPDACTVYPAIVVEAG